MPRPTPDLECELVTLRAPDPKDDAADYWEMNRDSEMHRWTGNRVLSTVEEARAELKAYVDMEYVTTWVIEDNSANRVVGRFFVTLEERNGLRVAGEGNRIARPYWRKGHNRAARRLAFAYVFGELEADLIETGAWEGNVNSIKSIEAHGFRFDREELEWYPNYARRMPMRYYTMRRDEWPAAARATAVG